jgi:hypothetical protein
MTTLLLRSTTAHGVTPLKEYPYSLSAEAKGGVNDIRVI